MRESASSKRASGEGSGVVKSTMSLGRGTFTSHMNCPKHRGHVTSEGLLVSTATRTMRLHWKHQYIWNVGLSRLLPLPLFLSLGGLNDMVGCFCC